jgi:hypothetical protein
MNILRRDRATAVPPVLTVICREKLNKTASGGYFHAISRRELGNIALN